MQHEAEGVSDENKNTPPDPTAGGAAAPEGGKGKRAARKRMQLFQWGTLDYLLENFTLIYPTKTVWDEEKRLIAALDALNAAYPGYVKLWKENPQRKMIDADKLVFDPTGKVGEDHINLFDALPIEPKQGECKLILQLLNHLCNGDIAVIDWVLKWIAYQLRHTGAKMTQAIVMHGDEGSGKNLFWEGVVRSLFGLYGTTIGQDQLDVQFNGWASRKLFVVADEVVTRGELRHHKGRLKRYVTGPTIQINEKNMPTREESNHMNFVYLSNETQPLALDESDRRYLVVWTPPKRDKEFYQAVWAEAMDGGLEAFLWHLLNRIDLADFNEHTHPVMTKAKDDLIELSLTSAQLFVREWREGLLPIPWGPARSMDLFNAYRIWCDRTGERYPMTMHKFSREVSRYAKKFVAHFDGPVVGKGQGTIILPTSPPGELSQEKWIGEHLGYFIGGLEKMSKEWGRMPRGQHDL